MLVMTPGKRPSRGAPLTGRFYLDWALVIHRNRAFLAALVKRDIAARYRGSALGLAWLVGIPLIMMAAHTFVFGGIFKVNFGTGPVPTALAIWCGTLSWQILNETVSRSASILHDNAPYVKRIPFPLALLPVMPLGTAAIGALVSLSLFALAYVAIAGCPPLSWLAAPVTLASIGLVAAGTAWLAAGMGAFMRDLKHVIPLGMTLLMFVTPVFYPLSAVPPRLEPVVRLNPLTTLFEHLRASLLGGAAPPLASLLATLAVTTAYAAVGYWVFAAKEWEYADVV